MSISGVTTVRIGLLVACLGLGGLVVCRPGTGDGSRRQDERLAHAQLPQGDQALGALLEEVRAAARIPGIAAAVVGREGVVALAAAGYRRADEDRPVEPTDQFHLGSNTKAMTAFVVARFVERGLLRWETTLAQVFPEWRSSMDPAYREVPIRDLLRHRAGMPALMKGDDWLGEDIHDWQSLPAQRRILARNALHHPPQVPPGTFLYSNAGYAVAGAVLEAIAGRRWEDIIREDLFAPLHMSSCGFGPPARGRERNQPSGHVVRRSAYEPDDGDVPAVLGPGGTVHCSLGDWASFVRANMEGAAAPLVSAATLAALHEPLPADFFGERTGYAMGWVVGEAPWAPGPLLAHEGSNDRFFALVRLSPVRGLAFLVVVNAADERARGAARDAYVLLATRYGPQGESR